MFQHPFNKRDRNLETEYLTKEKKKAPEKDTICDSTSSLFSFLLEHPDVIEDLSRNLYDQPMDYLLVH